MFLHPWHLQVRRAHTFPALLSAWALHLALSAGSPGLCAPALLRELAALTLHSPVATRSLSGVVAAACPPRTQRASAPRRVHCSVTAECAARTRRMRVYRLLSRCGGGTTWMSHRSQLLPRLNPRLRDPCRWRLPTKEDFPLPYRAVCAQPPPTTTRGMHQPSCGCSNEHVGDAEAVRSHARPLAGIRGLGIVLPIILRRAAPRRAAFNQTNGRHGGRLLPLPALRHPPNTAR